MDARACRCIATGIASASAGRARFFLFLPPLGLSHGYRARRLVVAAHLLNNRIDLAKGVVVAVLRASVRVPLVRR